MVLARPGLPWPVLTTLIMYDADSGRDVEAKPNSGRVGARRTLAQTDPVGSDWLSLGLAGLALVGFAPYSG